jgi:hypothetical protein
MQLHVYSTDYEDAGSCEAHVQLCHLSSAYQTACQMLQAGCKEHLCFLVAVRTCPCVDIDHVLTVSLC